MSRRRKPNPQPHQEQRRHRNTRAERPSLDIRITMQADGAVAVDPKYNNALMEHLDVLYEAAERDDYEIAWTDDHKIAYFIADMMDGFLAQWDSPVSQQEVDASISEVPHIKDDPVVERMDIANMEVVK